MTNSAYAIGVSVDPTGAWAGAAQVNRALASIGPGANNAAGSVGNVSNAITGMNRNAVQAAGAMQAANQNFARSTMTLNGMVGSLGRASLALTGLTALTGGVVGLATVLSGAADKAAQIEAKLRNATNSTKAYGEANETVRRIANATRSDLVATTDLYSKFAKVSKNAEQATKTFAMALAVSGATANQAEAAILQFGQALQSGKLSGDEFTSLNENAGRFMDLIAESMGVGRGELKKLASEGKITGEVLEKALTNPELVKKIEAEFGRIPVTFGNVRTAVGNMMVDIAGALKQGLGIDQSLAVINAQIQKFGETSKPFFQNLGAQIKGVFEALAPVVKGAFAVLGPIIMAVVNNMESIVRVALAVGAAFTVMKASLGLQSAIAHVIGLNTSLTATGGVAAFFSGAMTMARNAVNGFTMALLANPITAIAVALTAGIALLIQFSDKIKLPGQEFGRLNDIVAVLWSDFMSGIQTVIAGVQAFASGASKVIQAAFAIWRNAFSTVVNVARGVFNVLNSLTGGWLGKTLGFVGRIVNGFQDGLAFIQDNWSRLPAIIGNVVSGVANMVIGGIEGMVNKAIDGLNQLIELANRIPKVDIDPLGPVRLGRVDINGALSSVRNRAEARGRTRFNANNAGPGAANDNGGSSNTNTNSGGSDAAGDAASKAKEARDAMAEFWTKLEEARASAGLMGIELERHNAILEYRKILGKDEAGNLREITALDRERINTLLKGAATAKIMADLEKGMVDRARETALLRERGLLLGTMTAEQVDAEMAIRARMREIEARVMLERGDMNDEALRAVLAREEATLRENAAITDGNRLLSERMRRADDLISRYTREADPMGAALRDREQRDADIRERAGRRPNDVTETEWTRRINVALQGSAKEYEDTMRDISERFRNEMLDSIDQIADAIGGKWGEAISKLGSVIDAMARSAQGDHSGGGFLGGIGRLFGGAIGSRNAFGQGFDQGASGFSPKAMTEAFRNPIESLKGSFDGFANLFKNGSFAKSLGSVLGAAGQGGQIGSAVAGFGKLLWKDFNSTGSQIGGMIGSVVGGPIGSIIGSIGGGILGGLFGKKKAPSASSSISVGPNGALNATTSGSKELKGDVGNASQAVIDGITSIAARLGADMGGVANVSIGKYKHLWKVSTSGGTVGKKHGIDFGEDSAAAIKFAIQDAIKDGILTGLSSFSNRLLRSATNLDSAVALAEGYEKLLKELANLKDPIGASIRDVTDGLEKMVKQMKEAGATSDELAKIEEYKKLKIDAILKDQLSGLTDFRRELFGEGSGVSQMNQLMAAQAEFARLDATIRSGGTVDQDEFTRIGQEVLGLSRDIFGSSSSQFQAIRQALIEATDGAINNVTDKFKDATTTAIEAGNDRAAQDNAITHDLLRRIADGLGGGGSGSAFDDYRGGGAINGVYRYDRV